MERIQPMKLRHLYLWVAVTGLVLPYSQLVPWVMEHHGVNIGLFLSELFANRIRAFLGMDVLVSAIVLIVFIQIEGQRLPMPRLWLPIAFVFLVGVSLALPVFLYQRQVRLDHRTAD